MKTMQLAQVNIARMKAPIDSELMSEFVANLDSVNELAEGSDGFVWRLKGDENNATALRIFEDDYLIINMSVWESVAALKTFVYSGKHLDVYLRKKEWFHSMTDMHMAMWYVPIGHEPTPDEAKDRLQHINAHGETPHSFTFKSAFTPSD